MDVGWVDADIEFLEIWKRPFAVVKGQLVDVAIIEEESISLVHSEVSVLVQIIEDFTPVILCKEHNVLMALFFSIIFLYTLRAC
jgi:hypothetical protein